MYHDKKIFSLHTVFQALIACDQAVASVAGYDRWRLPLEKLTFKGIDSELEKETVYAPSKNMGNPNSVWAKLHFKLLLPALSLWKNLGDNPEINKKTLSNKKFKKYFVFHDALYQHLLEYQKISNAIILLSQGKIGDSSYEKYFFILFEPFLKNSEFKILLSSLSKYTVGEMLRAMLKFLPQKLSDLAPKGHVFLEKAKDNNLLGRILQSLYTDCYDVNYQYFGIDPRAKEYFKGTLYLRLIKYVDELKKCPISLNLEGKVNESFPIENILQFYGSWYLKPSVVEMLVPEFIGAAENAIKAISSFSHDLEEETEGRFCLLELPLSTSFLVDLSNDEDFLRRAGRLALCIDSLGLKDKAGNPAGNAIRQLCVELFSQEAIYKIWDSPYVYLPSINNSRKNFQQDIVILLRLAILHESDEQDDDDVLNINILIEKLRHESYSTKELRILITDYKYILLNINAKKINPIEASAIGFILRYFGLAYINPIAIPFAEIRKGFKVFLYNKELSTLHMTYKEDTQIIDITIPVSKASNINNIFYAEEEVICEEIVYPAKFSLHFKNGKIIEIPSLGRMSYDILGIHGSAHGGEVIGFGCSVFFSGLQIALLSAVQLGADKKRLDDICLAFNNLNPNYRQRPHLVEFFKIQIWHAAYDGRIIKYNEWAQENYPEIKALSSFDGYHQRLAELTLLFPKLYSIDSSKNTYSPRISFYNGKNVEEAESNVILPIEYFSINQAVK